MLIHEFEDHTHRLVYEDGSKTGEWAKYEEAAILDDFRAVTNHLSHCFPPVFKIVEVTHGGVKPHPTRLPCRGTDKATLSWGYKPQNRNYF